MGDVDWMIIDAQTKPCPGIYEIKGVMESSKAGSRMGNANPKTFIEWEMYRAEQLPGPGEYNSRSTLKQSGGGLSRHRPKTALEVAMLRASRLPGPGQYPMRSTLNSSGGRFSTGAAQPSTRPPRISHKPHALPC